MRPTNIHTSLPKRSFAEIRGKTIGILLFCFSFALNRRCLQFKECIYFTVEEAQILKDKHPIFGDVE